MPSIADFSINIDKGYAGASTFTFTNQSTSSLLDTAVWEYAWDFGDGATSTVENPTHTYSEEGDYTVTLTTNDGTDVVPDPLPEPPPPPLTNETAEDITIYSIVSITGDPHSSPENVMKQYGNTEASTSYNYEMGVVPNREVAGETIYIHATQVPEFLSFRNTDPNDTDHYSPDILSEAYIADLNGAPVEEWDVGTSTIIVTLTQTLLNGEVATDVKEFNLTFGNHPHMPIWGDEPVKETAVGQPYSQTVKAIDDDLMGDTDAGTETLSISLMVGEIVNGVNADPLPGWLNLDLASTVTEQIDNREKTTRTATLSGTPSESDKGTTILAIECLDSYGLSAKMVFGLTVL